MKGGESEVRGELYARECLSYVLCAFRGSGSDAMERGMGYCEMS